MHVGNHNISVTPLPTGDVPFTTAVFPSGRPLQSFVVGSGTTRPLLTPL